LLQLKSCGIDKSKQEEQLILSILSKLSLDYFVFVSSFYTSNMTMGATWKIPPMDAFIESLIHEKYKFINMGALKNSKSHVLAIHERNQDKQERQGEIKGKEGT
jgi:hypothetical protein